MTATILGLGLVSRAGARAREHVFFARASAPPPWPSPFSDADDRPIDAGYCPWIEPFDDAGKRLAALGCAAVDEAVEPLATLSKDETARVRIPLLLCLPEARPDLGEPALATVANEMSKRAQAVTTLRFPGAAGAFAAIERALAMIASREATAVVLAGVDSFINAIALEARAKRPPSPFLTAPAVPGEGASAILFASVDQAARWKLPSLGDVVFGRAATGRGHDGDDEPLDGVAMTELVRSLPATPQPIRSAFGPFDADPLRMRDWELAVARMASRFHPEALAASIESIAGDVGAASGVMNIAFGVATVWHGAAVEAASPAPFAAWAISRDGKRGVALGSAQLGTGATLLALAGSSRARKVTRDAFAVASIEGEVAVEGAPKNRPANDIALAEPPMDTSGARPLVRLVADRPRAFEGALTRQVVEHCLEAAALFARDRATGPWRAVPEVERRLLATLDAIVAAGPSSVNAVARFSVARRRDPWKSLACALGLFAFEGADIVDAASAILRALPETAGAHVAAITEGLALSEHPELVRFSRALFDSDHPISKAVGVRLLGVRSQLLPHEAARALAEPHPLVALASIAAVESLPAAMRQSSLPKLRERALDGREDIAWAAARALVVSGDPQIAKDLAQRDLVKLLGPNAIEMLALIGTDADRPRVEPALAASPITPARLDAAARCGHAGVAGQLIAALEIEGLEEAGASALETLLGSIVPRAQARDPGAWRAAIKARPPDGRARLRRGAPWSAAAVEDECASGDLSRVEMERRCDELRARLAIAEGPTLAAWNAAALASASTFFATVRRRADGSGHRG